MSARVDILGTSAFEAYDAAEMGGAVRVLRRERGWTQAVLASWLGVSRANVISLEQGGPVSIEIVMLALAMLGAKAVIVPKSAGLDGYDDTVGQRAP